MLTLTTREVLSVNKTVVQTPVIFSSLTRQVFFCKKEKNPATKDLPKAS
jgi:hypothetical protein